jgi:hypothetical protein
MPQNSPYADYFDNIADPRSRQAAIRGYLAKELILRAAVPSRAASALKWYRWISRLLGNVAIKTPASWVSNRLLDHSNRSIEDLPDKYLVLHEDVFFVPPVMTVVRKLAPGHFVLQGDRSKIGIIACRRGSIESAILADCLGRAGVRHILYIGTCLKIGPDVFDVLVPTSLLGNNDFLRVSYGEPRLSDTLSLELAQALSDNGISTGRGPVFEAHCFLREEGPAHLKTLQKQSCMGIEMEIAGLAAGMSQFGGQLCAALIPLDSFDAESGLIEPLNSSVAMYLRLMKPIMDITLKSAMFLQSYPVISKERA